MGNWENMKPRKHENMKMVIEGVGTMEKHTPDFGKTPKSRPDFHRFNGGAFLPTAQIIKQ